MSVRLLSSWACAAALTGALTAQTTWIVDASGGPGSHFTTLPSAVAAAAPGDILLVRSGTYTEGFTTGKGLTILGQPSFTILPIVFGLGPIVTVASLPAHEAFVLANCSILFTFGGACTVQNSAGRVHWQNVSVVGRQGGFFAVGSALQVIAADDVTLTNCSLVGNPALSVSESVVTIAGGTVDGADSFSLMAGIQTASGLGLIATDSDIAVSQADITGGNGGVNPFGVPPFSRWPGRPAIGASGSALVLTGTAAQGVRAGMDPNSTPIAAISAAGGSIDVDPMLVLQGRHGGPAFSGTAAFVQRRIVSLLVTGGEIGARVETSVVSPAGDLIAVFVGVPIRPLPSPFGPIHVDLTSAIAVLFGAAQPPSGLTRFGFLVPNQPAFRGIVLGVQAANFYRSSSVIEMSNAGVVVAH